MRSLSFLERERVREHRIHLTKLRKMKPQVDTKPPKPAPHLNNNSKKALKGQLRQDQIQKDNQLLLSKLMKIESSHSRLPPAPSLNKTSFELAKKQQEISAANIELLRKIHSARPHYPRVNFLENYNYSQYLTAQLSENAKRVPRATDFSMSRPWSARVS